MECKIKLNMSRYHAEMKLAEMLRDYYEYLKIHTSFSEHMDDAHHMLLDISKDADVCFRGEW